MKLIDLLIVWFVRFWGILGFLVLGIVGVVPCDLLERVIREMTYYVWSRMLNSAHTHTHPHY